MNGGTLYAIGSFSTESGYDYLTIKGLRHEGTASFPTNIVLNAGEQFTWRTDGSVTRGGFTLCICSGTAGAYSMVGTACSHYTQTTCPAGYWGDASTMTCAKCATNAVSPFGSTAIADCTCEAGFYGNGGTAACAQCDATAGRVSNGVVGAATESGACVDAAFTYTGSGVELLSKLCITDGVDDYGANEKATITVRKVGRIFSVGVWKTANAYNDYILLNGVKYGGLVPPPAVALKVGDTFVWQSSGWYHSEGWTLCLCDTQGSYKAFIDGLCMTFTQTSCPTGYWGDSVTSSCIKCDHSVGRVGNGLLNATAEADACVDAAFTFTGSGIEYSSPTCITDGAGNYGANEAATITIVKSGVLMVIGTFATGNKNYDYLTVRNIRYGGSTPPGNLALSVGETIAWTTSSYTYMQSEGFTLCLCTLEGFKLFVNDACMTFTRTSCPTGYWGDSVTSTCFKCDHSVGRVGNGLLNATAEADACVDAAFTFTGSGIEYSSPTCITDGAGNYGANEAATITIVKSGVLMVIGTFATGNKNYDYLTVRNIRYGGSTPPGNLALSVGETIAWTTSSYTYMQSEGFTLCLCTLEGFKLFVNDACMTFTRTTCPTGYWGDSVTSTCVKCDHSAGRVGNGLLNATVEADACVDAAFTFSGSGIEYAAEPAAHECVTTGADSYGGNEQATITATVPGLLYTRSTFSTYSKYYDYLRFKGERYGGSVPPSHVLIQQGETLTWTTSSYSHTYGSYAGFTLCICDTTQPYAALVNAACKTYSIDSCPAGTWADESTQRCQECGSWLTSPIGSKSIAACAGVELKHHPGEGEGERESQNVLHTHRILSAHVHPFLYAFPSILHLPIILLSFPFSALQLM